MHYIPKYSRDRKNKRQSQKFVTVLDKKKLAKSLDENKLIVTDLRVDTLKKVKLTGNKTKMEKILRGFNGASFNHLLSEEEKEAFEKIIEVLSKTELSVIQINKVLYSVDTELYKVAMNKSLRHLKSNQ